MRAATRLAMFILHDCRYRVVLWRIERDGVTLLLLSVCATIGESGGGESTPRRSAQREELPHSSPRDCTTKRAASILRPRSCPPVTAGVSVWRILQLIAFFPAPDRPRENTAFTRKSTSRRAALPTSRAEALASSARCGVHRPSAHPCGLSCAREASGCHKCCDAKCAERVIAE